MMKNGKKDMSDKLKLKGHMKAFMRWPLILSALLIVLNIWVYFVSVNAGIIVSGGISMIRLKRESLKNWHCPMPLWI